MNTNISIIKKLARLGVLDTEPVKYKKEGDIIIKNSEGVEQRVLIEGVSDDDLPLLITTEQTKESSVTSALLTTLPTTAVGFANKRTPENSSLVKSNVVLISITRLPPFKKPFKLRTIGSPQLSQ